METNGLLIYGCCAFWLFLPVVTFAAGYKLGRDGMGWRVRVERVAKTEYAVEE